jgi:alpha-beta hydrolase superfamily lysophospholipase
MTGPAEADPAEGGGELRSSDGLRLHFRSWTIPRPRAALLAVHGLGEHSGRLASPAAELARRGIDVFALDLRGHGLSVGRRGHAASFARLLDDVRALHREVARRHPSLPTLLFGHSLGGLVATRYLQSHPAPPLRGAVLSAPQLGLGRRVAGWRRALARTLEPVLPSLQAPSRIDAEWLSHDPEEVAAYREDPLVHGWITPRLFTEMERAMRLALAERERIGIPLLVLVPEADRLVDPEATLRFCRGMPFEVRRYPDLLHEPLHEVRRAEVLRDVIDWIETRIG